MTENSEALLADIHSGEYNYAREINAQKVKVDFGKNIGIHLNPIRGEQTGTASAMANGRE